MIERVINKNQTLRRVDLINALLVEYSANVYKLNKSLGSIGGAVTNNFITYNKTNDTYTRVR